MSALELTVTQLAAVSSEPNATLPVLHAAPHTRCATVQGSVTHNHHKSPASGCSVLS